MTKELIENIRQTLIPFVKKELLKINYEDLGKSDAKEFEKDLNEVLDLAIKALEQQENKGKVALIKPSQNTTTLRQLMQPTSEDCVSRQAVKKGMIKYGFRAPDMTVTEFIEDELPPMFESEE